MSGDGPPRMVKRPTGSGGEPSSPNRGVSAGGKARQLLFFVRRCRGPAPPGPATLSPPPSLSLPPLACPLQSPWASCTPWRTDCVVRHAAGGRVRIAAVVSAASHAVSGQSALNCSRRCQHTLLHRFIPCLFLSHGCRHATPQPSAGVLHSPIGGDTVFFPRCSSGPWCPAHACCLPLAALLESGRRGDRPLPVPGIGSAVDGRRHIHLRR